MRYIVLSYIRYIASPVVKRLPLDYNSNMHTDHLALLQLMQLADSALPVGAAAHSFGLETLVAEEYLEVTQLGPFLRDYLEEAGVVEGAFCRLGYRLASHTDRALFTAEWLALNEQLSAIKTARESRAASAACHAGHLADNQRPFALAYLWRDSKSVASSQ